MVAGDPSAAVQHDEVPSCERPIIRQERHESRPRPGAHDRGERELGTRLADLVLGLGDHVELVRAHRRPLDPRGHPEVRDASRLLQETDLELGLDHPLLLGEPLRVHEGHVRDERGEPFEDRGGKRPHPADADTIAAPGVQSDQLRERVGGPGVEDHGPCDGLLARALDVPGGIRDQRGLARAWDEDERDLLVDA